MRYFNHIYIFCLSTVMILSCNSESSSQSMNSENNFINENALIINHEDQQREYLIYVPNSYNSNQATPLVLSFHGGSGTAYGHMQYYTDMRSVADTAGFLIVYPQGSLDSEGYSHWNSMLYTEGSKSTVDDIGFIQSLLNDIEDNYNIDTNRIYASGFSNGADFSFSLSCYLNSKFAAIASVSGLMAEESATYCNPISPTGIMIVHGTSDTERPYSGINSWYLSIDSAINYWVDYNNLDSTINLNYIDDNNYQIENYNYLNSNNKPMLKLLKIINGGHYWFDLEYQNQNLDQTIWNFFTQHSKN